MAVMLEVIRVLALSGRTLRHPIVFLFNGGEYVARLGGCLCILRCEMCLFLLRLRLCWIGISLIPRVFARPLVCGSTGKKHSPFTPKTGTC